ncbi:hypothetical protein QCN29_15015 [Streptomyces sp. HNM0663]|uniref:Uncharacterized protein n=1 Tax=Streptomyces chengmaiensis TaxID=3040919 RepID=A0ABT6HPC7_9ACTN|nr:hypothetical protein [Streptomyces chengmaiensis]MDH2390078.1 hypothetical protein [Streptomyces chengmaiensis]
MTEQTSHQDDRETRVRRPFGYRPYLVPNDAGRVLDELTVIYADGDVGLEGIAKVLKASDDAGRTLEDNALGVLDVLRAEGTLDAVTYERLRGAVERAGDEQVGEAGAYGMSTRERTDEPAGEGGFVDDFTSAKGD